MVGDQPPGAGRGRVGPPDRPSGSRCDAVPADALRSPARCSGVEGGHGPGGGARRRLPGPGRRGRGGRRDVGRRPGPRADRPPLAAVAEPGGRRAPPRPRRHGPGRHPPGADGGSQGLAELRQHPARQQLRRPPRTPYGGGLALRPGGGGRGGRPGAGPHRPGRRARAPDPDVLGAGPRRGDPARPWRRRPHRTGPAPRPGHRAGRRRTRGRPRPADPGLRGRPEHDRPRGDGRLRGRGGRRPHRSRAAHPGGHGVRVRPGLARQADPAAPARRLPGRGHDGGRAVGRSGRGRAEPAGALRRTGLGGPGGQQPRPADHGRHLRPALGRRVRRTAGRRHRLGRRRRHDAGPAAARRAQRPRPGAGRDRRPQAGPPGVVEHLPGRTVRPGRRRGRTPRARTRPLHPVPAHRRGLAVHRPRPCRGRPAGSRHSGPGPRRGDPGRQQRLLGGAASIAGPGSPGPGPSRSRTGSSGSEGRRTGDQRT